VSPAPPWPSGDCDLAAHAWWNDRLDPDWRPHTSDQNQAILDSLGLGGPFWTLP
jgi:hypothetical protein